MLNSIFMVSWTEIKRLYEKSNLRVVKVNTVPSTVVGYFPNWDIESDWRKFGFNVVENERFNMTEWKIVKRIEKEAIAEVDVIC